MKDEIIDIVWLDYETQEPRTDGCIRMLAREFKYLKKVAANHPVLRFIEIGRDEDCWNWKGPIDKHGYGLVDGLFKDRAHRAAWVHFSSEPIPAGQLIRHQCDNPGCCNPFHLLSGTVQDNIADRVARGRSATGEKNGRAKITALQAAKIKASGDSLAALARKYGLNARTVADIRSGVIWKSV